MSACTEIWKSAGALTANETVQVRVRVALLPDTCTAYVPCGVVEEIENLVQESPEKELAASTIGERLMERLKEMDQVAYVRFASVYRQFGDLNEFMEELKGLLEQRK